MPNEAGVTELIAGINELGPKLESLGQTITHLREDLGITRNADGRPIFVTQWIQEEGNLCLYVGSVQVADISAATFFARTKWHLRYNLPTLRPWAAGGQSFERMADARAEADSRVTEFLDAMWRSRDNG